MSFSAVHLIILFHLIRFDTLHKYSIASLIYSHHWRRRKPKTLPIVSAKDLNLAHLARAFGMNTGIHIFSFIKGNFAFKILVGRTKLSENLQCKR